MVLITFSPKMARLIISSSETKDSRRESSYAYLEKAVREGRWDEIPPIWISPNIGINGLAIGLCNLNPLTSIRPFIVYNGNHRRDIAIKYGLELKAYLRFSPGNPSLPPEERVLMDPWY